MNTDINADNANEEHSAACPPRHRRRSSFFERRSLAPESIMVDEGNNTHDEEKHNEYLNQYYAQLLKEKELWKKEVQHRRGLLHDVELQLNMERKSDKVHINYSILSNEDIEFLRGKPNLTDLVDSVKKLHEATKVTYAFYKRLEELNDVILNDVEVKLQKITKTLLENSAGIN